ncbi:hypothetical protein G7Y89_g9927 [Cudoniella acicularis]|uniref:FAD-binding domain-containing protein n=1 Tax=Cudoniella acicularis TaxID=354080 RepID=A0A8H4VZN8_9HELO|nr:hypothetical protein G7Y89_g9927 [Cudoniella acicularis]
MSSSARIPSATRTTGKVLSVVIVGGSLMGLMHGIMLLKLGHNVHILEKSPSQLRENQAAGITTGPQVQQFFHEYDTEGITSFSHALGAKLLDKNSKVRLYRKSDLYNTSWDALYYGLRTLFNEFSGPPHPLRNRHNAEVCVTSVFDCGKRVLKLVEFDESVSVEYEDLKKGFHRSLNADLVIAADGGSSDIRRMILPSADLLRPYSGYLTWRGTIPENEVSEETRAILGPENNAFVMNEGYIVVYIIPGLNGSCKNILTDKDGRVHRFSLPSGKLRPEVWNTQKAIAGSVLSSPYLELVNKIKRPFVTVITDTYASQASFMGGKLLLVGDALSLFRPHIAMSTNQAAFDCLAVRKMMTGEISLAQWQKEVLQYSHACRLRSQTWGAFFQVGWFAYFNSGQQMRMEMTAEMVHLLEGTFESSQLS